MGLWSLQVPKYRALGPQSAHRKPRGVGSRGVNMEGMSAHVGINSLELGLDLRLLTLWDSLILPL